MAQVRSLADILLNREGKVVVMQGTPPPPIVNLFRNVAGRLSAQSEEATPVKVVNDVRVEPSNVMRSGQVTLVPNVPIQIVNQNPFRRRLRLRNLTVGVQYFVGPTQTVSPTTGFLVDASGNPSDELVLPYTGEVWLVSAGAPIINWLEET